MRKPPRRTPTAPTGTGDRAPDAERAVALGPSAKVVVTIDSAAGEIIAVPSPCAARAPLSQASLWASPPSSEASENSVMPTMNIRRRPKKSASRPPSSRKPPKVSV